MVRPKCCSGSHTPYRMRTTGRDLKRLAAAVQLRPWPPHFKAVNGIASYPPSPLSVRYFSARSGSVPGYDDGEGLNLELPLAQSAFSPLLSAACLKIAASIAPAAAMRSSLTLWV